MCCMDILSTSSQAGGDAYLFGWDETPGIVSVWANREGKAVVWQRTPGGVVASSIRFRPWLFATKLDDLAKVGIALTAVSSNDAKEAFAGITYQEFDGVAGTYRYLLSAPDGRALEREIVRGASRRLDREIRSIRELEDDYYQVGPVEQYLMQSGRVYFRGLAYDDVHRLQFDLETTALDPRRGRIFMVAIRDNQGLSMTLDARQPQDEARLIRELCALVLERDPDILENHNLFGFDLPFLEQRAAAHRIPLRLGRAGAPPLLERLEETFAIGPEARKRTRYSLAGRELVDTLDAVRRHDFVVRDMPSYSLKDAARYFGIASLQRVYIEGAQIFETYRRDPERVRQYALDDVAEVDGLSRRLLGAPFSLASMAPRRYERLVSAGPAMGILEPILVRAYLRSGVALPGQSKAQSGEFGLHEGGAVHLFAEGVAEHVVKADVASLYPSLMRTFGIGPASDRLGVLLSILGQLTDLRLMHKAAAKLAPPGSVEANHHEATQAAMKILVNSAYGYMGAGSMALFADSRAAGEVTRRGREILDRVLDSLRRRGMTLIDADTDGVYFAVPREWSEEQERELVEQVGAELPQGIRLEYEGRYRAMFSHEVKNYALLTYGGQLIVRGVALRSSRAEPFGERFLRQALLCLLTNDIPGLRRAFIGAVQAIRNGALPASDMASRVRLSKSSETYLATRSSHSEAQYEALLAAGRTRWYPGERVRFYRARNKSYVWLPDESEETSLHRNREQDADHPTPTSTAQRMSEADRHDYDVDHYLNALVTSYAGRLKKGLSPQGFEQLFRLDYQEGLFDLPIEEIEPRWVAREG